MASLAPFVAELHRRKVIRPTLIYAGLAWVAIQVVVALVPTLGGPPWLARALVVAILLGLPVAVVVSWLTGFDPESLRRALPADDGRAPATGADGVAVISRPPPAPTSPLVGRTAELDAVAERLGGDARVVTITGPGGTGKTRLAIAVADRVRAAFPGGLAYVSLAPVAEAGDVLPALARALDVPEAEGRSPAEGVATRIGDRRVLLVLDNCEHVLDAAPGLAAVLARCPALRILATSRAPLKIRAEAEVPLHPLALPPRGAALGDLAGTPSVALFVARAQKARPGFALTADNADAVAAICRRLDGLPLALELAAARMRVLDPEALLDRLGHALDVLTTGDRDLPERQRTLRATIAWSHDLLTEPEQQLFRRLAVFAGGWTQGAAEAVGYDADAGRALDEVTSLVEKGLVQPDGAGRFDLLETIRAFALEQLDASGETDDVKARHAAYVLTVAEEVGAGITGATQLASMDRADRETANLQEALGWFRERALGGDAEAAERGMQLCGALWLYWHIRGRHLSARAWTDAFLDAPASPARSLARARALNTAGMASWSLGETDRSVREWQLAVDLAGEAGREPDLAVAGFLLGIGLLVSGRMAEARGHLEASVARAHKVGAEWTAALAQSFIGYLDLLTGRPEEARRVSEAALETLTRIGDYEGSGFALSTLATLAAADGDHEQALALYARSQQAYETLGDRPEEARVLDGMGWTALALERTEAARGHFLASLRAYEEIASERGVGVALLGLAATAEAEGQPERAVRLAAAAEVFSEQQGIVMVYADDSPARPYVERARAAVSAEALERLTDEGRRLSVPQAVQLALAPAARPVRAVA
ncbi:ATP-binding protein [Rubrivirga sp. IMCC45206]|uniref:ATP-binding protein n=1 Tax=Rubrivirga sp. IMCC45206 TaxID=3391614 RepID=UPI00398FAADE